MTKVKTRNTAYKTIFNTPQGKEVLKDLLKFCHFDSPTFMPNDPYTSAFNEGKRRVALRILGIMNMDEEAMNKVLEELNQYRGL